MTRKEIEFAQTNGLKRKHLKEFWTIPDNELIQESSVDPMGVQAIWTYYGQLIFNEKITTVANDLRIFTIDLFHHHLLNRLYREYIEDIQQAKEYYKEWRTEYDVKAGILMFLEDLVTWVFYYHANNDEADFETFGILGLTKARRTAANNDEGSIILSASKKAGLLKNQLNLGMTGRYKGPLMVMDFFDRSLNYLPNTWEHIERFMSKWEEAIELENQLLKLITRHLFQSSKKSFPVMALSEIKGLGLWKSIQTGYLNCFGKRKLKSEIRKYWQDKLGLYSGAAKALFDQMAPYKDEGYIEHEIVFTKAKKTMIKEPGEYEKLENILRIEPFLSHSEYLLRYMAQPGVKRIDDIKKDLEQLRALIKKVGDISIIEPVSKLTQLQRVMLSDGDLEDWIKNVLDYHNKIMTLRGGNSWVSLGTNGSFKHYFGGELRSDLNSVAKYLKANWWWHTYYLETLRSIYASLN